MSLGTNRCGALSGIIVRSNLIDNKRHFSINVSDVREYVPEISIFHSEYSSY